MKRRALIIHGWDGSPKKDWIPWLSTQLQLREFEVIAPRMPESAEPEMKAWNAALLEAIGELRPSDILIGHSIGCQTILRFLESNDAKVIVANCILVAPWISLTNLEDKRAWQIADPWLKTSIDFETVRPKIARISVLFSDTDPWVPLKENQEFFKHSLHSRTLILKNRGHFTAEEGCVQIPEILGLL